MNDIDSLTAIIMATKVKMPDWYHGQCDPPDVVPWTAEEARKEAKRIIKEIKDTK